MPSVPRPSTTTRYCSPHLCHAYRFGLVNVQCDSRLPRNMQARNVQPFLVRFRCLMRLGSVHLSTTDACLAILHEPSITNFLCREKRALSSSCLSFATTGERNCRLVHLTCPIHTGFMCPNLQMLIYRICSSIYKTLDDAMLRHSEGNIGFMRLKNRVNVILSRARDGMYILGNRKTLEAKSRSTDMWPQV